MFRIRRVAAAAATAARRIGHSNARLATCQRFATAVRARAPVTATAIASRNAQFTLIRRLLHASKPAAIAIAPATSASANASSVAGAAAGAATGSGGGGGGGVRFALFGRSELSAASDFVRWANQTESECRALIETLKHLPPSIEVVRVLDELSDRVCQVTDVAELCRNVHSDPAWMDGAETAIYQLHTFIGELNTNKSIYDAISRVNSNPELVASFTGEQRRAAHLLQVDMEFNGIKLSDSDRQRLTSVQHDIQRLQSAFNKNAHTPTTGAVTITEPAAISALDSLPPAVRARLHDSTNAKGGGGGRAVTIPLESDIVASVLKWVPSGSVRRAVYIASQQMASARANLPVLDELIAARNELARILGYRSYAHHSISMKMAGTPEVARQLLHNCWEQSVPAARRELQTLIDTKRRYEPASDSSSGDVRIEQWDIPYYIGMCKATEFDLDARIISEYFPVQRVLRGLAIITQRLYGCSLRVQPVSRAESWIHAPESQPQPQSDSSAPESFNDVNGGWLLHKVTVWDDARNEAVGTVYFDLYRRANKFEGCATFTVRGARRLPNGRAQLPIVVLACNLASPATTLTHTEVETLFHEFGHTLHILFSRTEFQHLSGARGELEFAETPSTLMEYWAWDYRVLKLFAASGPAHAPTVIPSEMVKRMRASKHTFGAIDLHTQIVHSIFDLTIFGEPNRLSPTDIYRETVNSYSLIPYVPDTFWFARFTHLCNYGAGYYSYVYCRVFSSALWRHCFAADPLSRASGDRYRHELLSRGGAVQPLQLIRNMLDGREPSADALIQELINANGDDSNSKTAAAHAK